MPVVQTSILSALIDRMRASSDLLTITGAIAGSGTPGLAKVFNHVPQDEPLPYVRVLWAPSQEWDTKGSLGFRGEIQVDCWTEQHGDAQALSMIDICRALLQDTPLTITGGQNILLRYLSASIVEQPDGVTHRGLCTYDAIFSD
jgi:hypothetical protein